MSKEKKEKNEQEKKKEIVDLIVLKSPTKKTQKEIIKKQLDNIKEQINNLTVKQKEFEKELKALK